MRPNAAYDAEPIRAACAELGRVAIGQMLHMVYAEVYLKIAERKLRQCAHRYGVVSFAKSLNVRSRVEDDSREWNPRQIVAEPLEMPEIILADICTGLHFNTEQISSLVLDNEVDLPLVLVAVRRVEALVIVGAGMPDRGAELRFCTIFHGPPQRISAR